MPNRGQPNNGGAILLGLIFLIASIIIIIIQGARLIYWISIIMIIVSIIVFIGTIITAIFNKDEWDFDWTIYSLICVICALCFFLFIALSNFVYPIGYSNEAIKLEMEMQGILNIYEEISNIPNLIIDTQTEALCELEKLQQFDCSNIKQFAEYYKTTLKWKGYADKIEIIK